MRRLLPVFLALGLVLITACEATNTLETLTPTSSRSILPLTSTTGRPTLSPTVSIDYNAVFQELADQLSQGSLVEPGMTDDIQLALATFFNTKADRRLSIDRQPTVIDELRSMLDALLASPSSVTINDVDGDTRLDVLVAIPSTGLPGFVVRHLPEGFVGYQIPEPFDMATNGPITFERADDLDDDGVPEIVLTSHIVGASAVNTLINISRWDGQKFRTLLQTGISDWAGPATWELVPENDTEALVTTCPIVGPFDHKMLPHPLLMRTYRWQGGNLILDQTIVDSSETVRQQVNIAESAFRTGQLDRALAGYSKSVEDVTLSQEPETEQIDWRSFALFRAGEIQALLGNASAAKEAMVKVAEAGPSLSDLARAFLEGYGDGNTARGLAAIHSVNLDERFYFENGGNLGFPMDAAGILFPGLAVAAYLNTQPEAGRGSGEALTSKLRDLGLDVASSAIVDLNSDGRPEVVVVLNQEVPKELSPAGQRQTLWLLTRGEAGWWPQQIEAASSLLLTETVPVPEDGRRAVVYQRPGNTAPRQAAVSWNGAQALRYNLPDGAELVPVGGQSDPFQCPAL